MTGPEHPRDQNHNALPDAPVRRSALEHLGRSQEAIKRSARVALRNTVRKPSRALILGCGSANDIPLAWLADKFDHVTVVDIEPTSVSTAVEALPDNLRAKVAVVITDISGISEELVNKFEEAKIDSPTLQEFAQKASRIMEEQEVEDKNPDLGEDYAFVCSQLVMTQLLNVPVEFLSDTITDYEQKLKNTPVDVINALQNRVHAEHIRLLARLTKPYGMVHFADTEITMGITPRIRRIHYTNVQKGDYRSCHR